MSWGVIVNNPTKNDRTRKAKKELVKMHPSHYMIAKLIWEVCFNEQMDYSAYDEGRGKDQA